MVKKGLFVRIEEELYYRAKNISLYRDITLGQLMEDALRTYFASLSATYTNIMFLHKRMKDKVDYIIQHLKNPEKAQANYTIDEIKQLISNLLQVEDKRTITKYFRSLVALKVLEFHQYSPWIIINKVYPISSSKQNGEQNT
ncbi:MAG: hypothetical protein QXE78_03710 [Nitrososphaeria archaeon]